MNQLETFMVRYLEKYAKVEKMQTGKIWTVIKIHGPFPSERLVKKLENDCKQYFNRGIVIAYDEEQWKMLLDWQKQASSVLSCSFDNVTNRIKYTAMISGEVHRS
jgi:hypothetical protein